MKLIQRLSNSTLTKSSTLVFLVSILAVLGPVVVVSAGFWDAISHLQKEPEFFWSPSHMVVYTGVSMTACAAIMGSMLILRRSVHGSLKTGIKLVIAGSIVQIIAGFGDSISHDLFGIDGLISWSHQPLELGLVLASLGGVLILKNREHTKLKLLLPFSIITFLFFTTWLIFNLVLIFGHTIQCIQVYEIFSSGCSIL
ncbi:hypothetical protein NZNM25_19210 [Nitrosopumilus zosterae]|uniref:DUF998 domain-containing protein n=1 Tax=Nitrosopumilus zosterae TaxID=718286 RepID=A0A2S2KTY6_9ARCH|nr:hypothetical protein [Nitrosopumilus zosterae]BDQ31780.1 hypothetical protein NZOSNM25_001918 [Nitrosopumilus zosterae]GBH35130.1 hypothetical protein NZNM25_19210 [Nitrosopumilus zosterae]